MPWLERVQTAIRILLEKIETGEVVVDAVRSEISEQADTGLLFGENEATKITDELLDAGTDGNEIEVRAQVMDFGFDESFLQARVSVEAICTLADVNVDQPALSGLQKVEIEFRRKTYAEVDRSKARIALEQVE